jgi:hypothetical protein
MGYSEPDRRTGHYSDMANCSSPQDWTILPSGQGTGSVSCGPYHGWYKWNVSDLLQIEWSGGSDKEPSSPTVQAAREAIVVADRGDRRASKSGGLAAGG